MKPTLLEQYDWRKFYRSFLKSSFNILIPLVAILAAFVVSSVLIVARGVSPFVAYGALFSGAFGSPNAWATTLIRLTPLVFTGLAVVYGYRSGFFNIGAEGQLYMGAMVATWIGVTFTGWSGWLLIPFAMTGAALAGALWALLPGYLKAARGFNEVLTTLLMNYIALQFFEWSIRVDHISGGILSPVNWLGLKDPTQPFPKSAEVSAAAQLPTLADVVTLLGGEVGTPALRRFTLAALLAVLAAVVVYLLLFKTTTGFRARAVGVSAPAAEYMGVNVPRTIITTALISGALAGLAGAVEVLGTQHRVIQHFLIGAGFDGIPVALIGQLHPLGALLSALFFGALRAGANKMQIISGAPTSIIYVIQSLAILFAIAGTVIKIRPRTQEVAREAQGLDPEPDTPPQAVNQEVERA
ncbi:MAG: ABC transporter permease [Anaerolineales bacterium]